MLKEYLQHKLFTQETNVDILSKQNLHYFFDETTRKKQNSKKEKIYSYVQHFQVKSFSLE